MINYRCVYPNEIYHYGKRGMHWGERRYQYKDGSWTPLGRLLRKRKNKGSNIKADTKKKSSSSEEERAARRKENVKKAAIAVGAAAAITATAVAAYKISGKRQATKRSNAYASEFAREHRETMAQARETANRCKQQLNSQPIPIPTSVNSEKTYKTVQKVRGVTNSMRPRNTSSVGSMVDALKRSQAANEKINAAITSMNKTNRRWR